VTINLNPIQTTNASGTFTITLDGLVQGMAMDDPSSRNWLTGGILAPTETLPMFGGIPITEVFPPVAGAAGYMDPSLQTLIRRATLGYVVGGAVGMMTGVSVFNQNFAAINTPQSPVPMVDLGMSVHLYRFGTNARIAMAMDPAMSPAGGSIWPPTAASLLWDVANQRVTQGVPAAGLLAFPQSVKLVDYNVGNSMTVVYNLATGFATWNRTGNACVLQI
jgi:hypothetical protein